MRKIPSRISAGGALLTWLILLNVILLRQGFLSGTKGDTAACLSLSLILLLAALEFAGRKNHQ